MSEPFVSTRNACKLCTPLGACLAFKGLSGAMTLLHGSQGCSTYIRRYMISHFKEPIDIASSNFSEHSAVFGGAQNLKTALDNLKKQYHPSLIAIATTCLAETIGEDMPGILNHYQTETTEKTPLLNVSTASYSGTYTDGYWKALQAIVTQLTKPAQINTVKKQINLFPGICSPADLRHLKEICSDFKLPCILLPDYSETLDGPAWSEYQRLPSGGTTLAEIESMSQSRASLLLSNRLTETSEINPGAFLNNTYQVPTYHLKLPIGITATDYLFSVLELLSGNQTPEKYRQERGRLIDAYVDGHKYVSQKRTIIFGEPDLVLGLEQFAKEIGLTVVLAISGDETDLATIAEKAPSLRPDLMIGTSKGYRVAQALNIPLIRIGFPIHDRFGAQRQLQYGYRGSQELYDRIVNTLMEQKQETDNLGYSYL